MTYKIEEVCRELKIIKSSREIILKKDEIPLPVYNPYEGWRSTFGAPLPARRGRDCKNQYHYFRV